MNTSHVFHIEFHIFSQIQAGIALNYLNSCMSLYTYTLHSNNFAVRTLEVHKRCQANLLRVNNIPRQNGEKMKK